MKKQGYYSTGEFMKLTHITKKTIRYYDEHHILKPAYVSENGARFYTDAEVARLQQILLLKYLGFSLDDIRELTIKDADYHFMADSLELQLKLIEDRIEQLQIVAQTLRGTADLMREEKNVDWSNMLNLIHEMGMEKSLKNQYQNASNISSRIQLHKLYSQNKQGWFPWIYEQCKIRPGMKILEVGCGDGSFWTNNITKLPENVEIVLSDISEGMLRDARRNIGTEDVRFSFVHCGCEKTPFEKEHFNLVIANHVLFYCQCIPDACEEISRVLKPDGMFLNSAYGKDHMKEVSQLVSDFDDRIILSADKLYERFGREHGADVLGEYFPEVCWETYRDSLLVSEPEPLISYVLSCHGNQNQYILDHYKEFRAFVKKQIKEGYAITKDAGVFVCKKGKKSA